MKFYKKITNENIIVPSVFFLITSHHPPCQLNRTLQLNVLGHRIYLCTRCIGQYVGIILALVAIGFREFQVNHWLQMVIIFGILPFPATMDWFTQTMGLRESNNTLRYLTGFLYGVSIGTYVGCIFTLNLIAILIGTFLYAIYIITVVSLLYKLQLIEKYLAPYHMFLTK